MYLRFDIMLLDPTLTLYDFDHYQLLNLQYAK